MKKGREVFLVEIVYESGYSIRHWFYEFSFKGGDYKWEMVSPTRRIIRLGADDVSSIHQLKVADEFEIDPDDVSV